MPATDRVLMSHPTLPDADPVDVARQQYDALWKPLGWREVPDEGSGDTEQAAPASPRRKATPTADGVSAPGTPKGN